jgi:hypothetical protein
MSEESDALVLCCGDVVFFGMFSLSNYVVASRALGFSGEAISYCEGIAHLHCTKRSAVQVSGEKTPPSQRHISLLCHCEEGALPDEAISSLLGMFHVWGDCFAKTARSDMLVSLFIQKLLQLIHRL